MQPAKCYQQKVIWMIQVEKCKMQTTKYHMQNNNIKNVNCKIQPSNCKIQSAIYIMCIMQSTKYNLQNAIEKWNIQERSASQRDRLARRIAHRQIHYTDSWSNLYIVATTESNECHDLVPVWHPVYPDMTQLRCTGFLQVTTPYTEGLCCHIQHYTTIH